MKTKHFIYSLLCVVLLSLPWLGGSGITLLIGFVPLLLLQKELHSSETTKKMPLWIYVAIIFALWWGITTWWVGKAALIGAILSVIFGSALCTGAFMLYDWVLRKATKALAYTVFVTAWIAYEFLYITGEISFPWLTLGGGFANDPMFVQWYEYTGMLGGSLWALVCNLLIFEAVKSMNQLKWKAAPTIAVLLPIAVSLVIYYTYKEPDKKISVEVVQPNIDPYLDKFTSTQYEQIMIIRNLLESGTHNTDYILMPETALHDGLWEEQLATYQEIAALKSYLYTYSPNTAIICGATTFRSYESEAAAPLSARKRGDMIYDVYNSALNIDTTSVIDIHHKSTLVAGVEKMPYYKLTRYLEFLTVNLGGISGQLGVDSVRKVFTSPTGVKSGTAICYESIYGEYFGEFIKNGAEVMFVITNDGWWGNTSGHRNHFAYSRLRAIETRRSIARSANTGISGFIDQRGDVLGELGWDERGVMTENLSLNSKITFYVKAGDYIGRLSWYTLVLSMLYFLAYRVRRKNHLVQ